MYIYITCGNHEQNSESEVRGNFEALPQHRPWTKEPASWAKIWCERKDGYAVRGTQQTSLWRLAISFCRHHCTYCLYCHCALTLATRAERSPSRSSRNCHSLALAWSPPHSPPYCEKKNTPKGYGKGFIRDHAAPREGTGRDSRPILLCPVWSGPVVCSRVVPDPVSSRPTSSRGNMNLPLTVRLVLFVIFEDRNQLPFRRCLEGPDEVLSCRLVLCSVYVSLWRHVLWSHSAQGQLDSKYGNFGWRN